ncbi:MULTISPECIES: iron-containing alcohol dehydrogenase [Halanaerobium]|jgi:alcohol dehydrogenase|uniref:Alcohol dehydrogenase n=1 Tax=Halanaerobium saccharolyticum TaxID=43595 RepID=A0A4R7Z2K1_9FIRM|nr:MULTISPECIES: iron-containing alcohol dehydrogenase [Halanaerobium]PUU91632.1 MAG: alcohol dehydrogenase [Halanaerobium sp.]RAK08098.1 alcohol dehydrogenase [Halanaerobium saccharolyticum]TDP89111.1 alcohol dehydrogenase [Halanaerobium saccharolyticum]TDW04305.1 alcohol dehydrogenase [Halanaerobium saccharolyticum]TDX59596.1 alcohol dehydrogenase [Halanaerobium saccharolyticum]
MAQVSRYFIPSVNVLGKDTVSEIGEHIKRQNGSKALIVTDEVLVKIGIVETVTDHLEEAGIDFVVFDGVQPNPTVSNVEDGLKLIDSENVDVIVSLGGGSSHDCAKGIATVATNGGKIQDYEGLNELNKAIMPLVAVNTTAGTASEMTRFCIITDEERHIKMAIVDWRVTPNVSINDPVLMLEKPQALTANTGMDALTHAVEAYVSTIANPLTDSAAEKAFELIGENLRKVVANGSDYELREKMAYAQFLAGMAFNNASLGLVHGMAHQLGGFYDLPHGVCNAILLPHVTNFNKLAKPEKVAKMGRLLGAKTEGMTVMEAADEGIMAIVDLAADLGIPGSLEELDDVDPKDFETLAKNALADASSATNPRQATVEEVIEIFESAYEGF